VIAHLRGRLLRKDTQEAVVDVGGVGYRVTIPLSTFYRLGGDGDEVSLLTYTHVREDALALYGFLTERERTLFLLLLGVTGIGPRVALTVLSGIPPAELIAALRAQDVRRLVAVPGVGKKTAERMVLELAEKVASLPGEAPAKAPAAIAADDVVSALVNLGYRKAEAERAVEAAARAGGAADFGGFLKEALRRLTSG
jgi:Holliday junction DNA helicase RuvA